MKNNKGFSLVELIIVIAIMAILVGVMAPQLIKYIEKTNVSSDAQLCDSVRSAITTSMLDPEVVNAASNGIPTTADSDLTKCWTSTPFGKSVQDILGINSQTDLDAQIKSSVGSGKASGWTLKIVNGNSVSVYLSSSDPTGKKDASATSACIGSGPNVPK